MKKNRFHFVYDEIPVEIPLDEQRYFDIVKMYIDSKQYIHDLKRYCGVENVIISQIRIDENERIFVSYQSGNECGGFMTFLVRIEDECDEN